MRRKKLEEAELMEVDRTGIHVVEFMTQLPPILWQVWPSVIIFYKKSILQIGVQ